MLHTLRPRRKRLVFDLVHEAGFDTTDWIESYGSPQGFKANPKYCYEWSYLQPGRLIILNLWHPNMVEEDGQITYQANFRLEAEYHRRTSMKPQWTKRAEQLDQAIQTALRYNLPVRVILLDGVMHEKEKLGSPASSVLFRELDPEFWSATAYDWHSGALQLTRGIITGRYVDQFDLAQAEMGVPERRDTSTSYFVRDPAVRRHVLTRAGGKCELCGAPGFRMVSGSLYLETHHVAPLSQDGPDHERNVVALCANDHRRAHFSDVRDEIMTSLYKRLAQQSGQRN